MKKLLALLVLSLAVSAFAQDPKLDGEGGKGNVVTDASTPAGADLCKDEGGKTPELMNQNKPDDGNKSGAQKDVVEPKSP